ncbi:MAG TPA: hypothetical protein VH183_15580 [Burkholderiaceae bacterium]|jgi:hypothetical protein|nr:hypothetical protein [Burkholderiaceae bacterium]
MRVPIVAIAAAVLSWGVATAQTGPPVAPSPQGDATADIWGHLTGEQRKQLWQQLTPAERQEIWRRLPPEQQRAIRERLEQRQPNRGLGPGDFPERRPAPGPAPGRLSPEERRQLRDEIRNAHQQLRRPPGHR